MDITSCVNLQGWARASSRHITWCSTHPLQTPGFRVCNVYTFFCFDPYLPVSHHIIVQFPHSARVDMDTLQVSRSRPCPLHCLWSNPLQLFLQPINLLYSSPPKDQHASSLCWFSESYPTLLSLLFLYCFKLLRTKIQQLICPHCYQEDFCYGAAVDCIKGNLSNRSTILATHSLQDKIFLKNC